MTSPLGADVLSTSPTSILIDTDASYARREEGMSRQSPVLRRNSSVDDQDALERQRALDVDSAMQLSRNRSASVVVPSRPSAPPRGSTFSGNAIPSPEASPRSHSHMNSPFPTLSDAEEHDMQRARGLGIASNQGFFYEEEDQEPLSSSMGAVDRGEEPGVIDHTIPQPAYPEMLLNHRDPMLDGGFLRPQNNGNFQYNPHEPTMGMRRDSSGLGTHARFHPPLHFGSTNENPQNVAGGSGPPMDAPAALPPVYQPQHYRSAFDYSLMEEFAAEERTKFGTPSALNWADGNGIGAEIRRRLAQSGRITKEYNGSPDLTTHGTIPDFLGALGNGDAPESSEAVSPSAPTPSELQTSPFVTRRQRKLSQSNTVNPRRQAKLAMFEGGLGPLPSSVTMPILPLSRGNGIDSNTRPGLHPRSATTESGAGGHTRPYRFSFYSNAQSATIHARSLGELPAEGQSFEDLFLGKSASSPIVVPDSNVNERSGPSSTSHTTPRAGTPVASDATPQQLGGRPKDALLAKAAAKSNVLGNPASGGPNVADDDYEKRTWWLDVLSPTDEEMKMLSRVFSIHPLTTEDILMEEAREKIELFRNYYFVCFRGFDQDIYSPTHLEPLNMYIIVFREGTLSFHFRGTPHPQNVRRRIKQLKDYINVTADWISYALIDDITDAFGPLIQNIEYEVDSIDELVLILKDADQSDMLRRIGTCRKKVMGLLRLMGNKADVVKGLAKRCNENWSVAPKSDIGLYLSDIQDHLVTMTQNLNHYEKILSRSHSNYLAQISIEMTDANNQINEVLSKLTALGTVLVPMNLVTGLWGMNVHVPGQDIEEGYTWFVSIVGGLVGFAVLGFIAAYKLMVSR